MIRSPSDCKLICLVAGVLLGVSGPLEAGQYFQNFGAFAVGATNFNDGSTLSSTALGTLACLTNAPYNELQLTGCGATNVQSAFSLADLDMGSPVYAFSAKWNSEVYGSFPAAGDGFSFNFGPLSSVNLITNNAEESGYGTGLCFSVETGARNNPGLYVSVNGIVVASLTNLPAVAWGVTNTTRHYWEVDWNYYTGLSVRLDCQGLFTNVATTGFAPAGGDVFAWGARCDTNTDEVRLDNIVIVTGGNLMQLPTCGPYYPPIFSLPGHPAPAITISNVFDGNNDTYWEMVLGSTVTGLAGATVAPPNCVLAYAVTSGSSGGTAPQDWTLVGCTNDGAPWNACGTGSGYFLNAAETRCWLGTNSSFFSAYGIAFPGGRVFTLGELRFYALSVVGAPYMAWMQATATSEPWKSIACSSDGTKLAAAGPAFAGISLSTNSGATWTRSSAPAGNWWSIASSSDGTKLAAVANGGGIYASTNSGATWAQTGAPIEKWESIASSSDGSELAAVAYSGGIYVSTNSGTTWVQTGAPSADWGSIASSSDGTILAAGTYGFLSYIYVSTNGGSSWAQTNILTRESSASITSSSDGTTLAVGGDYYIFVSTNLGSTWTQTTTAMGDWASVACSSDGSELAAVDYGGGIYVSTNSGATWTQTDAPYEYWMSIASSSDGAKLAAVVSGGGIYTYAFATPPSPSLNASVSGGYPTLSWTTTNGGNFILQQNTDLNSTNWTNVTWPVIVNGSSYQVTDLPDASQKFYRLVTPGNN
jgi:photosystem II stability/assembly factor-like uncharacterized protein